MSRALLRRDENERCFFFSSKKKGEESFYIAETFFFLVSVAELRLIFQKGKIHENALILLL